ncbi:HAD-IA family hydrolase [Brevibacillus sp. AY1]|uniref:HAD family hydrolase n=1 Tax=Brevibacillus sp. AY1 TaxID=2807621 RepID=UPI0024557F0F|nr:HAD-IA family hydrolase [Brevibacillus sp. AY1]MDH4617509.1 HAD-IA family hydrolase [Brevibacillus sp. AY1]
MSQALLFDLDGTLLDSRDAVIAAVAFTAERYAPGKFSREDLLGRFGESFDDFLAVVAESAGEMNKQDVLNLYFAYVRENLARHTKLFPGVKEGLEQLKASGYQLGVVTNKQREFAVAGLELAGIDSYFDVVVAVDDVMRGKPSAEPVLRALTLMGKQPEQAMMIGDSRYDVVAAWEADVPSVVLEWYGCEEWKYVIPTYRYPDFRTFVAELLTVQTKGGR